MPDREVPSEAVTAALASAGLDQNQRPRMVIALRAALPHLHADLREQLGAVANELWEQGERLQGDYYGEGYGDDMKEAADKIRAALSTSTKGGEGK